MSTTNGSPHAILAFDINLVEVTSHLILRREEVFQLEGSARVPTRFTKSGGIDKRCLESALQVLKKGTGRELLAANSALISPSDSQGRGVDKVTLTWSFPAPLRAILIGLMPGLSVQAGENLLSEMPIEVIDRFTSTDARSGEDRINALLSGQPDLIVMVGGVEGGADLAIREQVELLVRALSTQPRERRPEVLYAGNTRLHEYLRMAIEPVTLLTTTANVRPGEYDRDLQPAREVLAGICSRTWVSKRKPQIGDTPLSMDMIRPRIRAVEDITRVIALCEKSGDCAAAVDLGGPATVVSIIRNGRPGSCRIMQEDPTSLLGKIPPGLDLDEIPAWSPEGITRQSVLAALTGDAMYPSRLPVTNLDAAIYAAVEQVAGRKAWHLLNKNIEAHPEMRTAMNGVEVDTILITGQRGSTWKKSGPTLMEVLNILQPAGLVNIFLDRENLAGVLGTAAHLDPRIPLHCFLAGYLPRLATVISPCCRGSGTGKILTVRMQKEDGSESIHEIRSGELTALALGLGETATLTLIPHQGASLGKRTPVRKAIPVRGSILGIVIDGRGRPLARPRKLADQVAWMKKSLQQAMELDL